MAGLQREEPFDPVCIPTITGNCGAERNVKGCSQFVAFSCLIERKGGYFNFTMLIGIDSSTNQHEKKGKKDF